MNTVEEVLATIEKYGMLKTQYTVLVAVSGGVDSLCLLHVLLRLKDRLRLSLHVFHLNHQIRGKAAEADASFVEKTAKDLNLPSTVLSYNVPAYAKREKLSLEEAAREIRYKLMDEVACRIKANRIALGHTADDQIETFLMRLLRGAGLEGLRGMPPVRGPFVRPLIEITHEEAGAFLRELAIRPRFDQTNLDKSLLRNRVRHDLIPRLLKDYNARFKEEALREIEIISADVALLEELAAAKWTDLATVKEGSVSFPRSRWLKLPLALKRRLLRRAIKEVKGNLREITFQHVEEVLEKIVHGATGARVELPGKLIAAREYDRILIESVAAEKKPVLPPGFEASLSIPGETAVSVLNLTIKAELFPRRARVRPGKMVAYLDADRLKEPVVLRAARLGDRFRPLGMAGTKKLQDFFVDEKVPRPKRGQTLVVESAGSIAWVVGHRIADDFSVTDKTRRVVCLRAHEAGVVGGS